MTQKNRAVSRQCHDDEVMVKIRSTGATRITVSSDENRRFEDSTRRRRVAGDRPLQKTSCFAANRTPLSGRGDETGTAKDADDPHAGGRGSESRVTTSSPRSGRLTIRAFIITAAVSFAALLYVNVADPLAAQTPPDGSGVETAQPGDPVEDDEATGTYVRPDDLPDGVDTAQPGDPVVDEEEPITVEYVRPDDLPDGVDTAQPGDPVEEEGAVGAAAASYTRPADLPDGVDTAQPGDPVEEEEAAGTGEYVRPVDLPDGVDTAQPGDPVEDDEATGTYVRPDDLPEGVDAAKPGDPVEEGVDGLASTAPAPTGLRVTSFDDDSVTFSWRAVTDAPRLQTRVSGERRHDLDPRQLHRVQHVRDGLPSQLRDGLRVPGPRPRRRRHLHAHLRLRLDHRVEDHGRLPRARPNGAASHLL